MAVVIERPGGGWPIVSPRPIRVGGVARRGAPPALVSVANGGEQLTALALGEPAECAGADRRASSA